MKKTSVLTFKHKINKIKICWLDSSTFKAAGREVTNGSTHTVESTVAPYQQSMRGFLNTAHYIPALEAYSRLDEPLEYGIVTRRL